MNKINEEFDGELSMALEMFQGKYHRKFFNQLISSQLDVDRLDYLKRDSFFTGVSEGSVNTQRIIYDECFDDELVIDEKGVYSIENFLQRECLCIGKCIIIKLRLWQNIFGENLEQSQTINFGRQKY
jgi:HD superfamily phosphohydrolase